MSLDTPDNPIHDPHDVAYALVGPAKAGAETEAELRQGGKAATTTTVRASGLPLGLQLADYMAVLLRYR